MTYALRGVDWHLLVDRDWLAHVPLSPRHRRHGEGLFRIKEGLSVSQKTALTILHSVMAAVITLGGMSCAGSIASEQPLGALLLMVASAVAPSLIATRVTWASAFAAGRSAARERHAAPER